MKGEDGERCLQSWGQKQVEHTLAIHRELVGVVSQRVVPTQVHVAAYSSPLQREMYYKHEQRRNIRNK
jgi:hypothetical protein